jgi:two-component system cell cycle sensor histidine kinase PleC
MLAAALVLGWFLQRAAVTQSLALAEQHNVALSRALANSLRADIKGLLDASASVAPASLRDHPRQPYFRATVLSDLQGLDIVKVKVYDRNGITVFSTDPKQIGEDKRNNGGFRSARAGTVASELAFRNQFSAFESTIEDRNLLSSYIPIADADGTVTCVFEIYQDVTRLLADVARAQLVQHMMIGGTFLVVYLVLLFVVRRAERLARSHHEAGLRHAASAAHAESANRTKTEFLATMSHELRTPLNAILGFSEIIRLELMGSAGNPKYRGYAGDIHEAAGHLLEIINDILDLARVEAGRIEPDAQPINFKLFADSLQRMVAPQAEGGKVELQIRVAEGLPPCSNDERLLRQVALNLLSNAIKFTPAGGQVVLTVEAASAPARIALIVEDSGVGMKADDIPKALAPFSQIDNVLSRKHRGTGLGLSLANRFVRLLGGEMKIRSAPGRGTAVTVLLPSIVTAARPIRAVA